MFKGHCFPKSIILQAVCFKLRFSLSYSCLPQDFFKSEILTVSNLLLNISKKIKKFKFKSCNHPVHSRDCLYTQCQ